MKFVVHLPYNWSVSIDREIMIKLIYINNVA